MNTRIYYLYRDGSNNKIGSQEVLSGTLTDQQISDIRRVCDEGQYFIANDVGLPDLQIQWAKKGFPFPTDDDHAWSELESIEPTENPTTLTLTAEELYGRFVTISEWDEKSAMLRLRS